MSDTRLELVHRFFTGTGSTYDAMVHYATFGIDARWKRRIIDCVPATAPRILDLACGTGILTLGLAQRHRTAHIVGVELRSEYLDIARAKTQRLRLTNIEWVLSRAEEYSCTIPFDAIVSSYLAKYADLARLVALSESLLTEGGLLVMHDFCYPPKISLVVLWRLYFWILQRIGSRLFPRWREIFYGLPHLIEQSRWIPDLVAALEQHGFQDVRVEYLTLYGSAIVRARKGDSSTAT